MASSRRCPVKCWAWDLAPQPLGSSKNENLEPKRPQDLQIPGSFHRTDSRREPRQRCGITGSERFVGSGAPLSPKQGPGEQKREARPLRPPVRRPQKQQSSGKEPSDVGAHLRRPTRPLPVQTNTKPSVLGPVPTGQPPVVTPDMRSTLPLSKAPEVRACEPAQRCGVDLPCQALKSSCQDPPLIAKLTASRPDVVSPDVPQPARKTLAQTEAKHPPVASRPHPQPIVGKCGQNAKLGIQAPGRSPDLPEPSKESKIRPLLNPQAEFPVTWSGGCPGSSASPQYTSLGSKQIPQVTGKTPAQMPSFDPQAPPNSPGLSPVQACAGPNLHHPGMFQASGGKDGT
ncbi:hypothetical protein GH733_017230 [Mirounga leonina]|nr:hypothetical protein GH733_017230 [Mirounga leonina]